MDKFSSKAEKKVRPSFEKRTTVFVDTVQNRNLPVYIEATGVLESVDRMELYSEVQGVMLPDGGRFKAGNRFANGSVLVSIKSDDQRAQLVAQRSAFQSLLTSVMPDIRIDYSREFAEWNTYLNGLDPLKPLPKLPTVSNQKLKAFLTGRSIFSQYYSLQNLEIILQKYVIRAPYSGELVEANVNPGTVIRPGQKLGVFVRPGNYELKSSIDAQNASRLKIGQDVEVYREGATSEKWRGKISRINTSVDQQNQMVQFFVKVASQDLKEGMFLQARINSKSAEDAFEIPRSVLQDKNEVFVVADSILITQKITPVHFTKNTVIVKGLKNGQLVLNKVPPGSFSGMKVEIYSAD